MFLKKIKANDYVKREERFRFLLLFLFLNSQDIDFSIMW